MTQRPLGPAHPSVPEHIYNRIFVEIAVITNRFGLTDGQLKLCMERMIQAVIDDPEYLANRENQRGAEIMVAEYRRQAEKLKAN